MRETKAAKAPSATMTPEQFMAEQDAMMGGGPAMSAHNQELASPFAEEAAMFDRTVNSTLDLMAQGPTVLPPEYWYDAPTLRQHIARPLSPATRAKAQQALAMIESQGTEAAAALPGAAPAGGQPLSSLPAGANPAAFARPQF